MTRPGATNPTNLVTTRRRIRVLLVDGDQAFRETAVRYLKKQADMQVVGTAPEALDALARVANMKPHVILLALKLAGMSGWEAIPHFRRALPEAHVIVTTVHAAEYKSMALWIGADEIISRYAPEADLLAAIRCVANRHTG